MPTISNWLERKKKKKKGKESPDLAFMLPYYPVCKLPGDQTDGRPAAAAQDWGPEGPHTKQPALLGP